MNEVKVGKLPIIASYTCNFISKLLQGGKNIMAFCSAVQKFYWLFCAGSLEQEKENKILCIANEEMGANTFDSR